MSKFDDFNLDIKGDGNGNVGGAKSVTVDPWICTTTVTTMISCVLTECMGTGSECQGTDSGCSGDTVSACRSYCGGGCRIG